jgi:hypothetical protein
MTVGIPGTGIGGLFYFVLVALMPFHELYRTVGGRSSVARWRRVGFHVSILFGMFAIFWVEAWAIDVFLRHAVPNSLTAANAANGVLLRSGQFAALTSMIVLGTLLLAVAVLARTRVAAARCPRRVNEATA